MAPLLTAYLPCPPDAPCLGEPAPGMRDGALSVQVDCRRAGLDQLEALLAVQRPRAVVLGATVPMTARDVQHMTDTAFRFCHNVSIVGRFAVMDRKDTMAIRVSGVVRSLSVVDAAEPPGSMRGSHVMLFGDLHHLHRLHVSGNCHVHLAGHVAPTIVSAIQARTLTINGTRAYPAAGGERDRTYVFTMMAAYLPPVPIAAPQHYCQPVPMLAAPPRRFSQPAPRQWSLPGSRSVSQPVPPPPPPPPRKYAPVPMPLPVPIPLKPREASPPPDWAPVPALHHPRPVRV